MGNFFGLMKKPKEQTKESTLYFDLKEGSSCDYHRVTLPLRDVPTEFHPKNNIFVFNRMCSGGFQQILNMKREGFKIVVDWDDFFELEPDHYLYASFKSRGFTEAAIQFLQLADVVTVTTELLASRIRPYHRNVVVIRNALPFDTLQFTKSEDKDSGSPIIWAGGASHSKDLQIISGSFDHKEITIAGYEDVTKATPGTHQETSGKEWAKVANAFEGAILYPATKDTSKYMQAYDGHAFAVAPLVDNPFNQCKSNLKILEAGAKGIPIICSQTLPYFNPIDAPFVTYADKTWEWEQEIKRYLNNPTYREDRGDALAEHVRLHYNMQDANELRRQVYESL